MQRLDRSRAGGLRRTITESSRVMTCRSLGPGSGCGVGLPYCLVACGSWLCHGLCADRSTVHLWPGLCLRVAVRCRDSYVWLCACGNARYCFIVKYRYAHDYAISMRRLRQRSHARGDNVVGGAAPGPVSGKHNTRQRAERPPRTGYNRPGRAARHNWLRCHAKTRKKIRAILNLINTDRAKRERQAHFTVPASAWPTLRNQR